MFDAVVKVVERLIQALNLQTEAINLNTDAIFALRQTIRDKEK